MDAASSKLSSGGGIGRLYRRLWREARGRRRLLVTFLAMLLVAQAIRLLIPWFFGQAVNALQAPLPEGLHAAARYVGLMVAAAVASWALHGPGRVLERFCALALRESFADRLYAKAVSLPLRWHEANHSGQTIHRMNRANGALYEFAQTQFVYLQNAVNLVGPLVALSLLSPSTGGAALVGYACIVVILVRIDRVMVRLAGEENEAERRYTASLVDCLGNVATVLALRLQEATRRLVQGGMREVSRPIRRSIVVNEVKWGAVDLLNTVMRCGLVVLYAAPAYRATGSVLIGTAVMVYQYSQQIGSVIGAMASHWGDLVRHQTDIAAADNILDHPGQAGAGGNVQQAWREISIEGLTFAHPAAVCRPPTLRGVSLTLRRGARVALVGESGCGKSSLLRALAGLHEAESVRIAVDGVTQEDMRHLGHLATLVPQDPEVFETTLERNLTLGIDQTADDVRRACDLACLSAVIDALPAGLTTIVSERGLNLSGGQKQRIALARGLLASKDASIVLLDEPTSSVDVATEARIYGNLLGRLGADACVVSAVHRLHLLPRFDTVILLAEGRVADEGTLDELLARQPRFRAMWEGSLGTAAPPTTGEARTTAAAAAAS